VLRQTDNRIRAENRVFQSENRVFPIDSLCKIFYTKMSEFNRFHSLIEQIHSPHDYEYIRIHDNTICLSFSLELKCPNINQLYLTKNSLALIGECLPELEMKLDSCKT
jgi:hypothetical protein